MNLQVFITGLALVALTIWVWQRGSPSRTAETRLLGISLGDTSVAERLIEAGFARAPGISRAEAATRAVARYERDNR